MHSSRITIVPLQNLRYNSKKPFAKEPSNRDLPHDPSARNQRVDLGDDENYMNNKNRTVQFTIRFFTQRSRRLDEDLKMTNWFDQI